jgi:hypothetical protein
MIKDYLQSKAFCHYTPEQAKAILDTFQQEENEKSGQNIIHKFSNFQLNKVP